MRLPGRSRIMIVPEFRTLEEHVAFMEDVYGKRAAKPKKKDKKDPDSPGDKPQGEAFE